MLVNLLLIGSSIFPSVCLWRTVLLARRVLKLFTLITCILLSSMIQGVWKKLPDPFICIGFQSFLCSVVQ